VDGAAIVHFYGQREDKTEKIVKYDCSPDSQTAKSYSKMNHRGNEGHHSVFPKSSHAL
jgi:hypothetical protein